MDPIQEQSSSPAIPIAIVVGFALVAIAVFFSGNNEPAPQPVSNSDATSVVTETSGPRPVDETDYIRGNPNAPIMLIEYSDYDCPFCKQFHDSMNLIMDEFGVGGRVAWVYRQFPLEQLHPNSPRISEAALCVGDLGGNTAFWQFSDLIFGQREINEPTNVVLLPDYAEMVGVDRAAYTECMESGRLRQVVLDSVEDGFDAGIRGTPYTFVIAGNQQAIIDGARSEEVIRNIVSNLLDQLDGNFDPASVTAPVPPVES